MRKKIFFIFVLSIASLFAFRLSAAEKESPKPIAIDFFFSPGCRSCDEIMREYLPQLKLKFADKIVINYHDIASNNELQLLLSKEKQFGITRGDLPEIFLPNQALEGEQAIRKQLENSIQLLLQGEGLLPVKPNTAGGLNLILERFQSFSPGVVAFAGLADGVNPCAFAAMVFFVSFLVLNNYRKNQIIYIGSSFILAVFLTYLALGLGMFQVLKKLQIFSFFSQILYYGIALLALGLGIYSLIDYIKYKRTGQAQGCSLRWHDRLRALADKRSSLIFLVITAFINGIIIALLESACTGQVYFPTVAFVLKIPQLRMHAFGYLVLYNLLFILPLVGIFVLAYAGATSERFSRFEGRHIGKVKLGYTILFFSLAALLLAF
ncbi:MAG: hypothetical protein JW714_00395 [Candidatus Omnitrophica bacterium]|nr:hypothetical protein [Candidatus Omnitrophota bacterium]